MTKTGKALLERAVQAWKDFDKADAQYRQETDEYVKKIYLGQRDSASAQLDMICIIAGDLTKYSYDDFAALVHHYAH